MSRNSLNAGLRAIWNFEDPNPGTCVDTDTGGCALVNELSSIGSNILLVNQPSLGAAPKWEALDGTTGGQFTTGEQGTNFRDSSLFFDIGGGSDGDNLASTGAGGDLTPVTFITGQSFSIAFWVNPGQGGTIIAKEDPSPAAGVGFNAVEYRVVGGAGTNQWQVNLSDGLPPSGFHGVVALSPINTFVLNQYQLVTAIYDGVNDQLGISVDGAYPIFAQNSVGNFGDITNVLYMGRGILGATRVIANYKFLAFYNRIITPDECVRLYAGGRGIRFPFPDQLAFPDIPGPRITA